MSLKIGVDFGGVCSLHSDRYESEADSAELINIPDCETTLQNLKSRGHVLTLVSFCGAKRAKATWKYLKNKGLFDSLYFVKNKYEKGKVCKALGLDVLIDDRPDVLETTECQRVLFNYEHPNSHLKYRDFQVHSWKELETLVESGRIKALGNMILKSDMSKLCYIIDDPVTETFHFG